MNSPKLPILPARTSGSTLLLNGVLAPNRNKANSCFRSLGEHVGTAPEPPLGFRRVRPNRSIEVASPEPWTLKSLQPKRIRFGVKAQGSEVRNRSLRGPLEAGARRMRRAGFARMASPRVFTRSRTAQRKNLEGSL